MSVSPAAQAMVRPLEARDEAPVAAMLAAFLHETPYGALAPTTAGFSTLFQQFLQGTAGRAFVAEADAHLVGLIVVAVHPHPLSQQRMGSELIWWVDPSYRGRLGLRLLQTAEAWAKQQGATTFSMTAWNSALEAFYERLGFHPVERVFQKEL